MDVIPERMDFNDECVLLDLAYIIRKQTGYRGWSLAQYWDWLVEEYEADSNGRITTIFLDGYEYDGESINFMEILAFNLPPIIERLMAIKGRGALTLP